MRLYPALPFSQWPEDHRLAWSHLFADGDIFDEHSAASDWRPATIKTNRAHYGRWLSYCVSEIPAPWPSDTTALVTRENVKAYLAGFRNQVSPVTTHGAIVGISTVVKAMAPGKNWSWLSGVCGRLKRMAIPQTNKVSRMVPVATLYQSAIADMARLLTQDALAGPDCLRYRNNLMVALLAARPIRMRNFSSINLGAHLTEVDGEMLLRFRPEEVKNRQELVFDLPPSLLPFLRHYIAILRRPSGALGHDALWVGKQGRPLGPLQIYIQIMKTTERLVGVAINPHLFRDCAATSLAERCTSDVFAAAALLGHRDFSTTERHYIRARQKEATRRVNSILDSVRAGGTPRSGR